MSLAEVPGTPGLMEYDSRSAAGLPAENGIPVASVGRAYVLASACKAVDFIL
jgi:hypothetical protein